jgi:two-component system, OmpR family, response regulator
MRILVVEDSTPTRELLARSLASAGFEVTFASRLTTGRRHATEDAFDVIVLDIMLPDGSGLDLCRELRARGVLTPILFLTARGDVADRIAGLDAGGDDYLRKPFALAELQARLRALGRRHGLTPPARLESAGTVIDFTARKLIRDGAEVPLTAREWGVLELLASRAGRVVSRDELLDSLWGEHGPEASASLDVIMSRLRRKLGDAPEAWRLSTLRGEGYRFETSR